MAAVSALTKNNSELQSAERLKPLTNSRISIAIAQESRPPSPSSTEKPKSNTLDLGGSRKSPFAQPLKRPESTSSGPMRSSTGKTQTNQEQIGPFRSLCTPLRSLKTPSTGFNTVLLTDSKKIHFSERESFKISIQMDFNGFEFLRCHHISFFES